MLCPHCGAALDAQARFCGSCGGRLDANPASSQATPAPGIAAPRDAGSQTRPRAPAASGRPRPFYQSPVVRGGLVAGVLVAAAAGVFFFVRSEGSEASGGTTATASNAAQASPRPAAATASVTPGGGSPGSVSTPRPTVTPTPTARPTSTPAPTPAPPTLRVGGSAVVTGVDTCLNVRVTPGQGARSVACLRQGVTIFIDGGPSSADGYQWWHVRDLGWAAADWLRPLPQ